MFPKCTNCGERTTETDLTYDKINGSPWHKNCVPKKIICCPLPKWYTQQSIKYLNKNNLEKTNTCIKNSSSEELVKGIKI